jgi:hypothetical protein
VANVIAAIEDKKVVRYNGDYRCARRRRHARRSERASERGRARRGERGSDAALVKGGRDVADAALGQAGDGDSGVGRGGGRAERGGRDGGVDGGWVSSVCAARNH